MNAPCLKCTERHFKCHSECERYKEFRHRIDEIKEKEIQDGMFTEYAIARNKRLYRYRKK